MRKPWAAVVGVAMRKRIPLNEWVLERLKNCRRIAERKQGADKALWLEDAEYFADILRILQARN